MEFDFKQLEEEARNARALARSAEEKLEAARIKARAAQREPLKAIAKRAHDCLCPYNHTDGCSWGYEEDGRSDPWSGHAHVRWLSHFDRLVNGLPGERPRTSIKEIEAILTAFEGLKASAPNALYLIRQGLTP